MRTTCAQRTVRRRTPTAPGGHRCTHAARSNLKPADAAGTIIIIIIIRTICGTWYSVCFEWIGMCPVIVPGGFVYNNYTFFFYLSSLPLSYTHICIRYTHTLRFFKKFHLLFCSTGELFYYIL